jgi:hypothetical protein
MFQPCIRTSSQNGQFYRTGFLTEALQKVAPSLIFTMIRYVNTNAHLRRQGGSSNLYISCCSDDVSKQTKGSCAFPKLLGFLNVRRFTASFFDHMTCLPPTSSHSPSTYFRVCQHLTFLQALAAPQQVTCIDTSEIS